jgi:hypothetical protein
VARGSFRGDQLSRPRWASRMGALSWGLDLATFEGVPVRLHGFEMTNVAMLSSVFVAQLMRQIRARPLAAAGPCATAWLQPAVWVAHSLFCPSTSFALLGASCARQ